MFNELLWSVFQGVKEARQNDYERKFRNLNKTWDCWIGESHTSLLEVSELRDLLDHATEKEHYEEILDHLYRHDATRVDYYKNIEDEIIKRMW